MKKSYESNNVVMVRGTGLIPTLEDVDFVNDNCKKPRDIVARKEKKVLREEEL